MKSFSQILNEEKLFKANGSEKQNKFANDIVTGWFKK